MHKKKGSSPIIVLFVIVMAVAAILLASKLNKFLADYRSHASTRISGKFIPIVSENISGKTGKTQYVIQQSDGSLLEVPATSVNGIAPGSIVGLDATTTTISSFSKTSIGAITAPQNLSVTQSPPTIQSTGTRKIAVILAKFTNLTSTSYPTNSQALSVTNTEIRNFYLKNSYNKLTFNGSVFGPYTIDNVASQNRCDMYSLARGAILAADNDIDYTQFQHVIVVFPGDNCGYSGMGSVGAPIGYYTFDPGQNGGNGGNVNLFVAVIPSKYYNSNSYGNVTHEIGHNLGAIHANSYECGTQTLSASCTSNEYGDIYDDMGSATYHFSNYLKEHFGWYATSNIKEVTATGDYTIQPTEITTTSPQVLKILRKTNTDGTKDWFYIENRVAITGDPDASLNSTATGGSLVRYVISEPTTESNVFRNTQLLDTTPGSTSNDFSDAALAPNQQFTDSATDIQIKTVSKVGNTLTVHVVVPGSSPATVDLKGNTSNGPLTVPQNSKITLAWSSTNATSCTASGAWNGTKTTSGTELSAALTTNATYILTCGGVSDSVDVVVQPLTVSVDLKLNNQDGPITTYLIGGMYYVNPPQMTLSWTSSGMTSCTSSWLLRGGTTTKAVSGSEIIAKPLIPGTFTYKITCSGPNNVIKSDSVILTTKQAQS